MARPTHVWAKEMWAVVLILLGTGKRTSIRVAKHVTDPMKATTESIDLEHDLVQWIVAEAVRLSLETPLREPILSGVEGAVDTDEIDTAGATDTMAESTDAEGGSSSSTALRGLVGFAVMVGAMYVLLRRLSGDGEA